MSSRLNTPQLAALRARIERARENTLSDAIPRRVGTEPAELSFAQQRLWFLDQLMPGNPFYNIPAALPLRLALDERALRAALAEIVRRHEALRTTFMSATEGPRQSVGAPYDPMLPTISLEALTGAERQRELERLATDEARAPFDLERGPLVRARLVRLAPYEQVLLLTLHHIVTDGWSMGVLFGELMQLYDAYWRGRPSPLPALPIQYADYAAWQRKTVSASRLDNLLRYWRRQLAELPTLKLVTERSRPRIATFRGAFLDVAFDEELTRALDALARRHDATLFQVMLAAFKAVLARYAGQTDIAVGAPIANRTRPEVEGLIGFFVNTLVLRTDLNGNPTFAEVIARVRRTCIAAYEHQDLPFERLVEDLQPTRDMSRNPLAQVTFQIQNAPAATREKPEGLDLVVRVDRATAIFDMAFSLWETKQGLMGGIEFGTDVFDVSRVSQLVSSLRCVLQAVTVDDTFRLGALPLATPEQSAAHLAMLCGRESPVRADGLFAEFHRAVEAAPRATVLVDAAGSLSRQQLFDEARALAATFRAAGVTPDGIVALALPRGRQFVTAMLAALDAGAAWLPIDPALPAKRLDRVLQLARPQLTLREGDAFTDDSAHQESLSAMKTQPAGDNPGYVLFTSGSTGKPKGVVIPQRALLNHMAWMKAELPASAAGGRVLQRTPLHFDAAVWELWAPLLGDGVLLLPESFDAADTGQLCQAISRFEANVVQLVPSLLRLLLDDPLADRCRSLRRLCVGGEALSANLIAGARKRWPGIEVVNLYGPTETTIDATWWVAEPEWTADAAIPIGRPIWNTRITIRDTKGEPVPSGILGEIWIAGSGLARGYLTDDLQANSRFVTAPDGARYYRSGDLGWARHDGMLFCAGRMDEQVKIRGNRIELGDVEAALATHPAVQAAVTLTVPDQAGEPELIAFVALNLQPNMARESEARALEQAHVAEWQTLYECVYELGGESSRPEFDTVGWVSSYDGQLIPPRAMRDWLDATVARLRALNPRRVLEIGCGAGLIARELAPSCQRYVGCDFSALAIARARLALTPASSNVRLVQAASHEIGNFGERGFDLVILNSVVQYFPSASYLTEVLAQARSLLAPGGRIFIGDVRHFGLIDAFQADVQATRATADLSCADLRERVRAAAAQGKELLFAPEFFWQIAERLPEFGTPSVRLKRGTVANEMRDFRYDVLLQTGVAAPSPAIEWHDWRRRGLSIVTLHSWLDGREGPIGLSAIPNARVRRGSLLQAQLADAVDTMSASALHASIEAAMAEGIEPETLARICEHNRWNVELIPSPERADEFCVVLHRGTHGAYASDDLLFPRFARIRGRTVSNPLLATMGSSLEADLKSFLGEHVPSAMVPARIEPLPRIPLLANGKADRVALVDLAAARRRPPVTSLVPPMNALEALVADVWASVFRLKQIGVEDHFFNDLAGHSLLATQVASRIRAALEIDLPLRLLFEHPTVRRLCGALVAQPGNADLARVAELVREVDALDAATLDERLDLNGQLPP
jgi:amino acid adenylation domain-containing protein